MNTTVTVKSLAELFCLNAGEFTWDQTWDQFNSKIGIAYLKKMELELINLN